MATIYQAPIPRTGWGATHHNPYPLWIRDMNANLAFKIHIPPQEITWNKDYCWPTISVVGSNAYPIEYVGGQPYTLELKFPLIVENNNSAFRIYNEEIDRTWRSRWTSGISREREKQIGRIVDEYGSSDLSQAGIQTANSAKFQADLANQTISEAIIFLKQMKGHLLRVLIASSFATDAYTNKEEAANMSDLALQTGTANTEIYAVVMENLTYTVKQRHEIFNLPTYAEVTMKLKQS